jgi:hypothetical protein
MTFINVHLKQQAPAELDQTSRLPRLRILTNDPAREYAQRPGEVERLPDAVAALILCKQGFNKVQRNGIKIEIDGKKLCYWSEGSITIAEKAGTNDKILWTVNRQQPDVLHILTLDGEYVESIPLEGRAEWFDPKGFEILAAKRRANNRRMTRIADLHAPDAAAAIAAETHNGVQLKGLVQTFPSPPGSTRDSRVAVGDSPNELHTSSSSAETVDREVASGSHRPVLNSAPDASPRAEYGNREVPSDVRTSVAHSSARGGSFAPARRAGGLAKADRLHEIQRSLGAQRAAHEDRAATLARRVAEVTEDDLDDLTNDDGREPVAALTATENSAEEDASDWIL